MANESSEVPQQLEDSIWDGLPYNVAAPRPHASLNTLGMDPSQLFEMIDYDYFNADCDSIWGNIPDIVAALPPHASLNTLGMDPSQSSEVLQQLDEEGEHIPPIPVIEVDPLPHASLNTLGMDPSQSSEVLQQLNEEGEHIPPIPVIEVDPLPHASLNTLGMDPSQSSEVLQQLNEEGEHIPPIPVIEVDPLPHASLNTLGMDPSQSSEVLQQLNEEGEHIPPIPVIEVDPLPHASLNTLGMDPSQSSEVLQQLNEEGEHIPPIPVIEVDPLPHASLNTLGMDPSQSTASFSTSPGNEQMKELSGSNPPEQLIRMEKPPAEFDIRESIGSQDPDPFLREALELDLDESLQVLFLAVDVVKDYYVKGIRPLDLDFVRLISYSVSRTVNRFEGHYNMLNGLISPHENTFKYLPILSEGLKKIIITETEVRPSTPEQLSVTSGEKQAGLYFTFEDIKKPLQGRDLPSVSDCMGHLQLLKSHGMRPSLPRTKFSMDSGQVYHVIYDTDELEALMIYLKDCKSKFCWVCEGSGQDGDLIRCPVTLMPHKDVTTRFTAVDERFYSLIYRPTVITMAKTGWFKVAQFEISLDVCSNGKSSINVVNSFRTIQAEMKLQIPRDISLPQKRRRAKIDVPLERLLKHRDKTLKQAAHDIGVSETKLKDVVKELKYAGWKDFTTKSKNSSMLVLHGAANAQLSVASSSFLHSPQVDAGSPPPLQPISPYATETNSKQVMVRYGEKKFVFVLTCESKIVDLESEVTKRADNLWVGSFYLEYKNKAGDWICIACDEDIKMCMDSSTSSAVYAAEMRVREKGSVGSRRLL